MDYDLTPRKQTLRRTLGFTNKSMRVIDVSKPHIAKIDGWYRVSAMPRCIKPPGTRKAWYEAHAYVLRMNNAIHLWPYLEPVPSELFTK